MRSLGGSKPGSKEPYCSSVVVISIIFKFYTSPILKTVGIFLFPVITAQQISEVQQTKKPFAGCGCGKDTQKIVKGCVQVPALL
jgi:hypothetical protein